MSRRGVNRVVGLVLGIVLVAVGTAGLWSGTDLGPPSRRLRDPADLWSGLGDLAAEVLLPAVVVLAVLLVALGLWLLMAQLRPGRGTRRRRADLDLSGGGRETTMIAGSALSTAVVDDFTRLFEVVSASVVTWQDDNGTRLDAVVSLFRGHRLADVGSGIDAVLDRVEHALGGERVRATVRLDVRQQSAPRVR